MTTTLRKYQTLKEIKTAAENGADINWHSSMYKVKKSKNGEFNVICSNGHCSYFSDDYKAQDFYSYEN